jgi:hypothetical protein
VLRPSAAEVVRDPGGGAAIGSAMMSPTIDIGSGTLELAVASLDVACRDLDDAVLAIPNAPGDNVMASSTLVGLLIRVMAARRHVSALERGDVGRTAVSS